MKITREGELYLTAISTLEGPVELAAKTEFGLVCLYNRTRRTEYEKRKTIRKVVEAYIKLLTSKDY